MMCEDPDKFPYERRKTPTADESLSLISAQITVLRRRLEDHEAQANRLAYLINELKDVADARKALSWVGKALLWTSGVLVAGIALYDSVLRLLRGVRG